MKKHLESTVHIVGQHPALIAVLQEVMQVAPTKCGVLINGETGTGKELIAQAIHRESSRCDKPFIKINCGAISANLVESELFGHEKGSFTGAIQSRKGRFELADDGTLFLDEVAELSMDMQTKLLRILQEKEFERVGGNKTIKADVRIIAASHQDLAELVDRGKFRQDLFYRLNIFPLFLPSLRERKSDIPLLIEHIVAQLSVRLNKTISGVSNKSLTRMLAYSWPGNIRELQNVLERAAIMSRGKNLEVCESLIPVSTVSSSNIISLAASEKSHIQNILSQTEWKISGPGGAAELLEVHPNTLRSRMEKHNIKKQYA